MHSMQQLTEIATHCSLSATLRCSYASDSEGAGVLWTVVVVRTLWYDCVRTCTSTTTCKLGNTERRREASRAMNFYIIAAGLTRHAQQGRQVTKTRPLVCACKCHAVVCPLSLAPQTYHSSRFVWSVCVCVSALLPKVANIFPRIFQNG